VIYARPVYCVTTGDEQPSCVVTPIGLMSLDCIVAAHKPKLVVAGARRPALDRQGARQCSSATVVGDRDRQLLNTENSPRNGVTAACSPPSTRPRTRSVVRTSTARSRECRCRKPLVSSPLRAAMIAAMAMTRRADMFTADGKPSDDDPRENGPTLGDERTTLVEALRRQRLTLELKCSGLDAQALARRSVEPSTMSLLGLVRHLAEMERATFRGMMSGHDVPRLFCSDTDRDGDFDGAVPDPRVVAEAWDAWRAEVDFATRFVADAPSLDITGDDPLNQHGSGGGLMSLREVLVGMIEEYARHMGHVDLLRERIDGRRGQ
jgi:Protein of unknown function (DUF664)